MTHRPDTADWRATVRAAIESHVLDPARLEDLVEELAQHLESAEHELRARGVSPADARATLAAQLSGERFVEWLGSRPSGGRSALALDPPANDNELEPAEWILGFARDGRYAARAVVRERGFSLFVITALALGIGANAAMFGVLDRLMLRGPLHVRDPHALRRVVTTTQPPGQKPQRTSYHTYAQYEAFRADTQTFAAVGAYNVIANGVVLGLGENAREVNRGSATASFFPLLGVNAVLGRFFDAHEDEPDRPRNVVVLGYGLWQTQFGGTRDVIGRTIQLDFRPYTVIGVAPNGFTGVDLARVDVWLPESGVAHSTNWRTTWAWPFFHIIVRLRPGISSERATATLTQLHRTRYPGRDSVRARAMVSAEPVRFTYAGVEAPETRVSRWLFAVAAIVLVITCANVMNLLLARTARLTHELAVRLALGASRARLVRLLVTHTLLLCALGGLAALAVAYMFGRFARTLIAQVDWATPVIDGRMLVAVGALSSVTCLLVCTVPAILGSNSRLGRSLKAGIRDGGGRRAAFRSALTVCQCALSVALLIAAGLFVKSVRGLRTVDLGVETDRLIAFRTQQMGIGFYFKNDTLGYRRELARREAFLPMMAARLRGVPGVERIAIAAGTPFDFSYEVAIRIPGVDSLPHLPGGGPFAVSVSGDYFGTVGTRLLRGRTFASADDAGSEFVAAINETGAHALWPRDSALGKCVFVNDASRCARIVGILQDTKRSFIRDEDAIQVYVPREQQPTGGQPRLLLRVRGDAAQVINTVRRELVRADPTIWYVETERLQTKLEAELRPWRLGATIFTLFGALALVVAAIGLYSVISYLVVERRREIGVRVALGATPRDVVGLVLKGALGLAGAGVAIGVSVAALGSPALRPLLFGTSPLDPLVYSLVASLAVVVIAVAALIPAIRAVAIDPLEALRSD